MKFHNSTHYLPQPVIDFEKLNNYENLSTIIFLLIFHWVRRFFTGRSVFFPISKSGLSFHQCCTLNGQDLRWFQLTRAPTDNGCDLDGLASNGLIPQYQMKARAAGCYQYSEQKGKDIVACLVCKSVFLLSVTRLIGFHRSQSVGFSLCFQEFFFID